VDPEKLSGLRTLRQVLEFVAPRARGARAATASEPTEPAPEAQRSALQRRGLFACPLPPPRTAGLPADRILVTDDGAGLAPALVERLRATGADAALVPLDGGEEEAAGLVICAGPAFDDAALARAFARIRRAAPRLRAARGLLAVVSRRDGAFGQLDPAVGDAAQAGLAGLAKTAAREWSEVRCRAIDLDAALAPAEAAARLAAELAADAPEEVGLGPAGRVGLGLVDLPAPAGPGAL